MKKFLTAATLALSLLTGGAMARDIVSLNADNTIVFKGEVNSASMTQLAVDLITHPFDEVYIYIDSPGGSVFAASHFFQIMEATPKRTICIVDFAASAAFSLTQRCDERLLLKSGVLMQHQMSYGLGMQPEYNQENFIQLIKDYGGLFSAGDAKRIGMGHEEFKEKTAFDWWLTAKDAVEENVVDRVVSATCDADFVAATRQEEVLTWFGKLNVTYSLCPLIAYPLEIAWGHQTETDEDAESFFYANLKRDYRKDLNHKTD